MPYHDLPPLGKMAELLHGVVSAHEVLCPGPGHSSDDRSLSVKPDPTAPDGFLYHSFSGDDPIRCRDHVRIALGLSSFQSEKKSDQTKADAKVTALSSFRDKAHKKYIRSDDVEAEYIYENESGEPHLLVIRKRAKGSKAKRFLQCHRRNGAWYFGGVETQIPYKLPQLLTANSSLPVYFVEGEKCAEALLKLGFVATTASGGANKPWSDELTRYFKDRHLLILPDNDEPGRRHAKKVARALDGVAASIRIVELPDLSEGEDVIEFLQTDPTGARLVRQCQSAPPWNPGTNDEADQAEITNLTHLPRFAYAKKRKDAAKRLGIGVGELDKVVADARGRTSSVMEQRWKLEPWDAQVDTAELLTDLRDTFMRYVILPQYGAETMALWVLHAWTHDTSYISPFLMFVSPELRCGKSTALTLVYRTTPRSAFAANISAAAIFRFIEGHHPTLVIDEADTFARDNEEIRGILNSGHTGRPLGSSAARERITSRSNSPPGPQRPLPPSGSSRRR
jgi:5S rRNA maturation endonuclease (ribonuclease M5)